MKSFLTRWGLALLWMLIIFTFSSQPKGTLLVPDLGVWDFVTKKSAHFIEYAFLAVFMLRGARGSAPLRLSHLIWAFALTVLYAATDEYHQTFVPGREGHWPDVVVDGLGAMTGLILQGWRQGFRLPPKDPSPSKSQSHRR
ncbi:MAG: VanZ family protein [Chloroflexi bacterium]|nr:VanZ family protein [Chloroflexota bacterium]